MTTNRGAKLKLGGAVAVTLLCLIGARRNTETVEAKIQRLTISMPCMFLLSGTMASGFVSGVPFTVIFKGRSVGGSRERARGGDPD